MITEDYNQVDTIHDNAVNNNKVNTEDNEN